MKLNYLTNEKGERNAVVIPIKEWNVIERRLHKPRAKVRKHKPRLLRELEQAVEEVNLIKAGKKKSKTIEQLLNEL